MTITGAPIPGVATTELHERTFEQHPALDIVHSLADEQLTCFTMPKQHCKFTVELIGQTM